MKIDPEQLLKFQNISVLVIGDLMLDEYIHGEVHRISPEAPIPIVNVSQAVQMMGGAGNVANNLVSLGGNASLLGFLGEDTAAMTFRRLAREKNISVYSPEAKSGDRTINKVRVVGPGNHQMIRLDYDYPKQPHSSIRDLLPQTLSGNPDCIIVSDYAKGAITSEICSVIRGYCINRNIPWIVDPKPKLGDSREEMIKYRGCYLIKPNRKEAEILSGKKIQSDRDLEDIGWQLVGVYGSNVLITLGEDGMKLFTIEGDDYEFCNPPIKVADVAGAGDTVSATLALGIGSGLDLPQACFLANLSGGICVAKPGTATVSREELAVELHQREFSDKVFQDVDFFFKLLSGMRDGKTIVMANGCFDVFHAGHLDLLTKARKMGDYLVIALNSDQSVVSLKGPSRPINTWKHRAEVLAGLSVVDAIVPFEESSPAGLFLKLTPDIVVHGDDGKATGQREREAVSSYGGTMVYLDKPIPLSSTLIIQKLQT